MYQLLVVDDEQYALQGIMETIDWDSLGIMKVYGAECVADAKEIVLNHMLEVIICDIEMAEENGIDFLKWLHYGGFPTRLIFLTAHADFRYAQGAVQFDAFEYFLKPVEHSILKEGVRKALSDLEREMALHSQLSDYETILRDWEMIDELKEPQEEAEIIETFPTEPELIGTVRQYIDEHLGEVTRDSIAGVVAVNASYLSRVFHKETGEKQSAYILRKRVEKAKKLLADTEDKIGNIANELGYGNDSYFISRKCGILAGSSRRIPRGLPMRGSRQSWTSTVSVMRRGIRRKLLSRPSSTSLLPGGSAPGRSSSPRNGQEKE